MRLVALALFFGAVTTAHAATYYVSGAGNDSWAGTQSAPWRTLQHAALKVAAGDTVYVSPYSYEGEVTVATNGTGAKPISFFATGPSTKVTQGPSDTQGAAVWLKGLNIVWGGFEVDGSNPPPAATPWNIGIYATGSYDVADGNTVHDLGRACNSQGAGGIVTDHYYGGVFIDVEYNEVYKIGPVGVACNVTQGIYPETSGLIAHNKSHDNSGWCIVSYHDATQVKIIDNECYNDGAQSGGIAVGCGGFYTLTSCDEFVVENNNIHDEPGIGIDGNTTATYIGYHSKLINNTIGPNVLYGCVDTSLMDTRHQVCPPNP